MGVDNKKILLGIVLVIVLLFLAIVSSGPLRAMGFSIASVLLVSRVGIWVVLGLVILYSHKIEKQKLILWKEQRYPFYVYLLSVLALLGILLLCVVVLSLLARYFGWAHKSASLEKLITVFKSNYLLMVFTCLTAGITEELLFRAYLIPRLIIIIKKPGIAVFISALAFGLLHMGYGSAINVIGPFVIGLVFGIYYYKYRNIGVLIFSHFLWDYLLLLLKTTVDGVGG